MRYTANATTKISTPRIAQRTALGERAVAGGVLAVGCFVRFFLLLCGHFTLFGGSISRQGYSTTTWPWIMFMPHEKP